MSERRPSDKDRQGPSGRGIRSDQERPVWQTRVRRDEDREKSPLIPHEITPEDLEFGVRVQLKTLTEENAEMVARHLAMVSLLIDQDPELAHKHALAASRRASRLAVVHETLGITAYTIGDYALALRELLTHRRLSGSNDQLPLIVDSERGMGRPAKALEAIAGVDRSKLPVGVRINLAIALSGARLDLGQVELAKQELEIPELSPKQIFPQSPLLFRSYAEVLRDLGRDGTSWDDLALRAEQALESVGEETFELIEMIDIPEPYEVKPREERKPRPAREGDRPREGGSSGRFQSDRGTGRTRDSADSGARVGRPARPARDGERTRTPREGSYERPFREGREDRPMRGGRPPRPVRDGERERPAREGKFERPARPGRPTRVDRPSRDGSERPARDGEYARPKRDGERGRPARDQGSTSERKYGDRKPARPGAEAPKRFSKPRSGDAPRGGMRKPRGSGGGSSR
jgi:hypothetical protein